VGLSLARVIQVHGRLAVRVNLGSPENSEEPMKTGLHKDQVKQKLQAALRAVGEIIYGATIYEMVRDLQQERARIERLFVLIVFGDLLGVPILPPYYALRLFPYVVPSIEAWKRSMMRERDLTDMTDFDT
jgi:hypothetical protein